MMRRSAMLAFALLAGMAPGQVVPFPLVPRPGMGPEELRRRMEEMNRRMEEMLREMGMDGPGGIARMRPPMRESRLGAELLRPNEALADQLDLPKGQGLVVREVVAGSAGAKVGLRKHDILLELAGKPVPDDVAGFRKQLAEVKAGAKVEAVVMRKGRKETLKGLELPEAKAEPPAAPPKGPMFRFPNIGGAAPGVPDVRREAGGRFTVSHEGDGMKIVITGKTGGGVPAVDEVRVTRGGKEEKYAGLDAVPPGLREQVNRVIAAAARKANEGG